LTINGNISDIVAWATLMPTSSADRQSSSSLIGLASRANHHVSVRYSISHRRYRHDHFEQFLPTAVTAAPMSDADKAASKQATATCKAEVKEKARFQEMSWYERHKLVKKCVDEALKH
jgi:hypothetical protein